jgi:hypothetical protein
MVYSPCNVLYGSEAHYSQPTYRKHLRNASSTSAVLQHSVPLIQQSTMSYSYSNPYAQPQAQQSQPRSAFTSTSTSEPCQILFGGLPTDATENDLRASWLSEVSVEADGQELLVSPMLALSHHSFSVKGLYNAEGKSLGMSLIQVANSADAEKVRSHCSGQLLDAGK